MLDSNSRNWMAYTDGSQIFSILSQWTPHRCLLSLHQLTFPTISSSHLPRHCLAITLPFCPCSSHSRWWSIQRAWWHSLVWVGPLVPWLEQVSARTLQRTNSHPLVLLEIHKMTIFASSPTRDWHHHFNSWIRTFNPPPKTPALQIFVTCIIGGWGRYKNIFYEKVWRGLHIYTS